VTSLRTSIFALVLIQSNGVAAFAEAVRRSKGRVIDLAQTDRAPVHHLARRAATRRRQADSSKICIKPGGAALPAHIANFALPLSSGIGSVFELLKTS
jgi:hypothetical protein